MTKQEKTGKRNLHFNIRHKEYGPRLIAYDVDLVQYNVNEDPVGAFETKFPLIAAGNIEKNTYQIRCINNLLKPHYIPNFILVPYFYILSKYGVWHMADALDAAGNYVHIQYKIAPANTIAEGYYSEPTMITEYQFVDLLYRLRNEVFPTKIKNILFKNLDTNYRAEYGIKIV